MVNINLIKKAIKSEPMVEVAYLFGSQALSEAGSDFDFRSFLEEYNRHFLMS